MHIRIAGAGIAGLASAIALARAGHQVSVHEQASRIEEVGAGLQLGPNAVRALESLGAWQRLEPATVAPAAICVHDAASDRSLSRLTLGTTFARRFGAPYRVAHRADLLNALKAEAAALDGIEVHTGQRLTGLDLANPDKPVLRFNGEALSCDLAVAADGIRSAARQAIAAHVSPRQTGDVLYRAMCPASALPDDIDTTNVHMWLSPGAHVVAYGVSGGKRINIVASVAGAAPVDGWNALASRDQVLSAFPSACARLRALLNEPANWLAWSAADLEPFDGWSKGHAILVGDAAHATLPHLAQGAAMALEDAVELAKHVGDGTGIAAALARFEATRKPRTSRITLGSRTQGRIYKMSGPSALARNLAMKLLPASRQLERLAWIYEG
ncbi:MAG: FAD-dependent monooxygenase [Anderseniella sp.]|nr:FAD-dependent monooxygenase [Anderseniella sp.]